MAHHEKSESAAPIPPVGPDDHARGPADAPATVVVYGDYECEDSRSAWRSLVALEHRIGDRFRHFPLRDSHQHAQGAAELAEAAADHGKFWEVHNHLYGQEEPLDPTKLTPYAAQFGIPSEGSSETRFAAGHRYAERVEEDFQGGRRSGVDGTPSIFINGRRHCGGYDSATLERAITLAR